MLSHHLSNLLCQCPYHKLFRNICNDSEWLEWIIKIILSLWKQELPFQIYFKESFIGYILGTNLKKPPFPSTHNSHFCLSWVKLIDSPARSNADKGSTERTWQSTPWWGPENITSWDHHRQKYELQEFQQQQSWVVTWSRHVTQSRSALPQNHNVEQVSCLRTDICFKITEDALNCNPTADTRKLQQPLLS